MIVSMMKVALHVDVHRNCVDLVFFSGFLAAASLKEFIQSKSWDQKTGNSSQKEDDEVDPAGIE